MAHTYTVLLYHIVFSTKHRQPLIDAETQKLLYPYMAGIIANHGGKAMIINGTADHVHILCRLKSKPDVADVVQAIKGSSSKHYHDQTGRMEFAWQEGYGAFTVSYSQQDRVYRYIQNQAEHHRKRSFAEEYEGLLIKHGVKYDSRFFLD
ncbi:IS200/IS605 family transposase [Candidatus Sumerlaeota bacterium]|nr:IS200/IS605 family transposase [Candidatus Sumerlaeota bacterium]